MLFESLEFSKDLSGMARGTNSSHNFSPVMFNDLVVVKSLEKMITC